jgi:hypothetical protein
MRCVKADQRPARGPAARALVPGVSGRDTGDAGRVRGRQPGLPRHPLWRGPVPAWDPHSLLSGAPGARSRSRAHGQLPRLAWYNSQRGEGW